MRRRTRPRRGARRVVLAATVGFLGLALLVCTGPLGVGPSSAATGQVLYVGTFHHITTPPASTFTTIQAAVKAAASGDWILIAPGDYHESGDSGANAPTPADLQDGWFGGVD